MGKPIFVMREKDFHGMDYLIQGAEVVWESIYMGDIGSQSFFEAANDLKDTITRLYGAGSFDISFEKM